jgi:hypothetical protein
MKKIIFVLILSFLSVFAFAQKQKITIFCSVDFNGNVNYNTQDYATSNKNLSNILEQTLPDSIKTKVLVDPKKEYHFKYGNETILWLAQNDWKIVSSIGGNYGYSFWLLSREISLDAPARALFMEKLENLEIKSPK